MPPLPQRTCPPRIMQVPECREKASGAATATNLSSLGTTSSCLARWSLMWCRATCEPFRFSYSACERRFQHIQHMRGEKVQNLSSTEAPILWRLQWSGVRLSSVVFRFSNSAGERRFEHIQRGKGTRAKLNGKYLFYGCCNGRGCGTCDKMKEEATKHSSSL